MLSIYSLIDKEDHLKENVFLFSSREIFAVLFVEFPQSFTRSFNLLSTGTNLPEESAVKRAGKTKNSMA
jgi:hypothetical protein